MSSTIDGGGNRFNKKSCLQIIALKQMLFYLERGFAEVSFENHLCNIVV